MEFKEGKAIYIQIADYISETILKKKWKQGDRLPSVRELAVEIEVNPNTVMRSYSYLQDEGIIYNKRGIGYFVGEDSIKRIMKIKKNDFLKIELPNFFKTLEILEINFETLKTKYEEYKLKGVIQ